MLFMLTVVLLSLLAGICLTLFVLWYIFRKYLETVPYVGPPESHEYGAFTLPQNLNEKLKQDGDLKNEDCLAINLLFQFLFKELRYTMEVQKWFIKKLSLEFEELLTRTTTGKLFDSVTIRDIHLGTHFPEIRNISIKNVTVNDEHKHIDKLELCLDIEYSGGFQLSIDANMVLGKTAYLSVKVNRLVGQAQLQMTRIPYTHWTFSFYTEPVVELQVESQFQGRPMPHINSIINNQIRKALRKKHTLPHYKIRYKPFFLKLDSEEEDNMSPAAVPGRLRVTVVEVTRLIQAPTCENVYCSLGIDSLAWEEMVHMQNSQYVSLEKAVECRSVQLLGLIFRQEFVADRYQTCIVVDVVTPMSAAANADIRCGDILVAVDNKKVTSLNQVARLLKAGETLTLKIERKVWLQKQEPETLKPLEQKLGNEGLRHRKLSDHGDNSLSNPPSLSGSPSKMQEHSTQPSPVRSQKLHFDYVVEQAPSDDYLQVYKTKELPFSAVIMFNETVEFELQEKHQYLNISVWGKGSSQPVLLGHVSIPLGPMIVASKQRHYTKMCALLPSDPHLASRSHKLSSHPGFEPWLCYGDILLSFKFTSMGEAPTASTARPRQTTSSSLPAQEEHRQHSFVRTHFDRTTQCEFCSKKIWLKDAVQCEACGMTCHKKCVVKCQVSTVCEPVFKITSETTLAPRSPSPTPRRGSGLPEIVTIAPDDDISVSSSLEGSSSPLGLLENGDEVSSAFSHLLQQPSNQDPMAVAKSTGKDLYSNFPLPERKDKINKLIGKLKAAIDSETQSHNLLIKESVEVKDVTTQSRIETLISKSDEKLQALAVLMLHCCAGLQHVQDLEESTLKSNAARLS